MTSRSRSDVQIMLTASQSGNSVTSAAKPDGAESSFVFDSAIPEAYATVDTAQKEHAKYNSDQVRHPENQQGGVDLLYEFDGIAHSERSVSVTVGGSEGGGSGGGVVNRGVVPEPPSSHSRPRRRYEAANILYEDNELPSDTLKHRSLHAASYSMYPEKDKGSYITCRCKTRTLVVTFFTALAFLLALAALVLSVILWFGVYDSSSSSSPAVTPSGCNCPTEEEVEGVRSELTEAKQLLESIKNRSAQNVLKRQSLSLEVSLLQSNLTQLSSDLAALPMERKLFLPNVTLFEGCTKTPPQKESCTVPPTPAGAIVEPCLSLPIPVEEEGTFLLSAECTKTGDSLPEAEKISASLEIVYIVGVPHMRCRCSRILSSPDQSIDSSLVHVCSLIATRCPRTININTTLAWIPANSQ